MQVTKDSHSLLKVVPTTIPIGGPLGQQLRKTSMDAQVLVTRNLLIPDMDQSLKVVGRKKLSSFNGSASTTPRTKSITAYKSGSIIPGSYERDRMSSFGGEGIVKEDLKIEVPTDTQEVPGSENISPVKIAYSRNTPNVFDGFTDFDRMRDTELDNGDMSSTKIHSQHNQIDLMGTMDRRDDSTLFLNQNTSTITATRVFITNPERNRIEYDLSEMNRGEPEGSLEKLPEVSKFIKKDDDLSNSRTKWSRLSLVMKSLMLFKREEVKPIDRAEAIQDEINNFKLRVSRDIPFKKRDLASEDFAKDAFDLIRRVSAFCECASVGSPQHVELMKLIIEEDPKRFMLETVDPFHILNRKNSFGHTPMYIAAKNGNLEVIKLLVEKKANHDLASRIDQSTVVTETPLKAAVRWSHESVVEYLLANCEYNENELKDCLKLASNRVIKGLLRKVLKEKYGNGSLWFLCCCFKSSSYNEMRLSAKKPVTGS